MQVSLTNLKLSAGPVWPIIVRLLQNETRRSINAGGAITALADSTTGVAGATLAPVNTASSFLYTSGTTLAPRAGWNTQVGLINDALDALAERANVALTRLGQPTITGHATGKTLAAQANLVGSDGSSNAALLRSEANAQITVLRNKQSTVVRAINQLANGLGVDTVSDATGGKADMGLVQSALPTAGTAISGAGDAVSLADANAALSALRNNIATLAAKLNTMLGAGTIAATQPITLVP